MIKLIKETEERKAEEIVSLEEVGLEMIKLISLSFFDDLNTTLKVFKKVNKVIFEEEEVLKKKFVMFGGSHVGIPGKEWRKQNFMLTSSGIYKLKESKIMTPYKYMPFEKTRMVIINNEKDHKEKRDFLYGFHFFRTQKKYKICTNDKELFDSLKEILIYKTIQHTFHEEYDVQKLIGKGSFAKVYYAVKRRTDSKYAIKAFGKEGLISQATGREGLLNEINIMRSLHHKNILKLYEVYETEHSLYLVVDLLSGGELVSHIQKDIKPPSFLEISFLIKNLLEALDHMHSQGIMHRDIKPENLLLRDSSNVYDIVLADFGLSTIINQPIEDILFKRCGTPGFVAPEILAYKEGKSNFYNERCDIFSVGSLFYLLLTGSKLFKGDNCADVLKENKLCEINYESEELDDIPDIAIDLLRKMLSVIPEIRFSAKKALLHKYFETTGVNLKLDLNHTKTNLSDYKQLSPVSPHKQGMSPIHMKKTLLNGRSDSMENGSGGANISPKKGPKHLLGRMNMEAGFSEFTSEIKNSNNSTPKSSEKSPIKLIGNEKKSSSPLKPKK